MKIGVGRGEDEVMKMGGEGGGDENRGGGWWK